MVSVDLGVHNSACAHVDADLKVLGWKRLPLQMPKPYSPEKCYEEVDAAESGITSARWLYIQWEAIVFVSADPITYCNTSCREMVL